MEWKGWPTWLKGGLIVVAIDFLFWLYILLRAITCGGGMCGLGVVVAIYYGIPSLIPAFIVGAVASLLTKKLPFIILGGLIGFILSIIIPIFTPNNLSEVIFAPFITIGKGLGITPAFIFIALMTIIGIGVGCLITQYSKRNKK